MYGPLARLSICFAILVMLGAGWLTRPVSAADRSVERRDGPANLVPFGPTSPPSGAYRASEAGTREVTLERGGRELRTIVTDKVPSPDGRPMRAGSLVVTFKSGTSADLQASAHRAAAAGLVKTLGGADTVRVQVEVDRVPAALAAYRARNEVAVADPDYILPAAFTPNDPEFSRQYHLPKIAAPAAWEVSRSSPGIRIAVLDCGIYSASSSRVARDGTRGHPDVAPKVVAERNFTASPYGADDICGHGTHVAGIAAGRTNNALGVAGVGFDASILNAKVLDDDGSATLSMVVDGVAWAADNGARVITMSLGRAGPCPRSLQVALDYAWARGAVIIAAAGNENAPMSNDPGACANVVSVAATDRSDVKASFSNYGANVDVAAPGVEILSAYADDEGYGYATLSGTSFSAPQAAGLAALIWTTSYGTSPQAVADRMMVTADRIPGTGTLWSAGRINAAAAVAPTPIATPPPTGIQACAILGVTYTTNNPGRLNVVIGSGTITGTAGDDLIIGSDGDDKIAGLDGNDVICGRGGDDHIEGGAGNDLIKGGSGNDVLLGGPGDDVLKGGEGNDSPSGEGGNDTLRGGGGNDRCDGGPGTNDVNSSCETVDARP